MWIRNRSFGIGLVLCSIVWLTGCGARGPGYPAVRLSGAVTVNKQPLADGGIQFLPLGAGQGPAVGGVITNGRYAVDGVPLGEVRAVLVSVRKTHRLPPDQTGRERWATENPQSVVCRTQPSSRRGQRFALRWFRAVLQ